MKNKEEEQIGRKGYAQFLKFQGLSEIQIEEQLYIFDNFDDLTENDNEFNN